eukprot:859442_1
MLMQYYEEGDAKTFVQKHKSQLRKHRDFVVWQFMKHIGTALRHLNEYQHRIYNDKLFDNVLVSWDGKDNVQNIKFYLSDYGMVISQETKLKYFEWGLGKTTA